MRSSSRQCFAASCLEILHRLSGQAVERSPGTGVFFNLRVPVGLTPAVQVLFQPPEVLPRQPGDGRFNFCDCAHAGNVTEPVPTLNSQLLTNKLHKQ